MTNATLNHWQGARGERIYINAENGESLGYFEIFQDFGPCTRSYSEGGPQASQEAQISWNGQDGLASMILDATFGTNSLPGITSKQGWREVRAENPDLLATALRQAAIKKAAIAC